MVGVTVPRDIYIHICGSDLIRDGDGNYLVLELYKDEEALAAHGASEHFKAAGAGFKGLMAGAPEITRLTVVG